MEKPKLLYTYCGKVYLTYKSEYSEWINKHIENKPWHMWEEWAIGFGIAEKWFGIEDWYYDGHTFKGICLFKFVFFKMYSYQSEELK